MPLPSAELSSAMRVLLRSWLNDQIDDGLGVRRPRKPIVRHSLHDAIVSRVRDMVIEGTLSSGTHIHEGKLVHEGKLGQDLGVSRTPLREALKYLASEELFELAPCRGAMVRSFSAKNVGDSLIVLANLEDLAGRLACVRASDDNP